METGKYRRSSVLCNQTHVGAFISEAYGTCGAIGGLSDKVVVYANAFFVSCGEGLSGLTTEEPADRLTKITAAYSHARRVRG
jgi:hypothetical protein